jgi:acetyl esterase/lipase
LREAYANGTLTLPVSPRSPNARAASITGPGGEIGLRMFVPPEVRGAYLHLHGGGWKAGTNDMWDNHLEQLSRETGMAVVSVDYRLAPEHPFPAAIDDCVAAAQWLIERARPEFGADWLAIGGESAGAHLAASTLIRLRDAGQGGAFGAVSLMYGCFDLSLTPSMRRGEGTPILDRKGVEALAAGFCGAADPRDPRVSPLYADLSGLPPALFTVGTLDPLLDDTLFMYMRWLAAGNAAELAVYPGGVHAFNFLEGELAEAANRALIQFIRVAQPGDA